MEYGKLINGQITYVNVKSVIIEGMRIFNPSDEILATVGIYPINNIPLDGEDTTENGIINHFIGRPIETDESKLKINYINNVLQDTSELIKALEKIIAVQGITEEDRNMALQRIQLRDELGKIVITEEGDGSDMNPYKWTEGKQVISGNWYITPSKYIWLAINDGFPDNETDTKYFEIVGL